jgi:predicted metal-dependent hydrolase
MFKAQKLYDHYNKYYFSNKLPVAKVTVCKYLYRKQDLHSNPITKYKPGHRRILGCCNPVTNVIKIATHCSGKKLPEWELHMTLIHEMLHIRFHQYGMPNNHGNEFKRQCAKLEKLVMREIAALP